MKAERLPAFLAAAGRTPFVFGTFDCSLWLADWLVVCGYRDPASHLRGRYSDARGCARVLRRLGGVLGAVGSCADLAGLPTTDRPQAGDVGVVEAMTARGRECVGGLCTGPRWSVLAAGGLMSFPAAPVAAWSV